MRFTQSATVSPANGRKRRKPSSSQSQSQRCSSEEERSGDRRKHKKLDAICEKVYTYHRLEQNVEEGSETIDSELRRSTRVRRAPVLLDASPSPSVKRTRCSGIDRGVASSSEKKRKIDLDKPSSSCPNSGDFDQSGDWGSRLRSRAKGVSFALKGKEASPNSKRKLFDESNLEGGESDDSSGGFEGAKVPVVKSKRSGKMKGSMGQKGGDQVTGSSNIREDENEKNVGERLSQFDEEDGSLLKSTIDSGNTRVVAIDSPADVNEKEECTITTGLQLDNECGTSKDLGTMEQNNGQLGQPNCDKEGENNLDAVEGVKAPMNLLDGEECHVGMDSCQGKVEKKPLEDENSLNGGDKLTRFSTDVRDKPRVREGRRCGLCGGGTDGKPPKKLVQNSAESDYEAYGGSSASEEPNYDVWDGFGDEPGWLGRLLGPIHDRFGIAGVWVHQHCAVWSPEVWFIDLAFIIDFHTLAYFRKAVDL